MQMPHAIARRERGFSLIEVLITLLVVAVGLLSSASLQVLSKRSNFDAAQRTNASWLAMDLFERMRGNTGGLATYLAAGELGGGTRGAAPAVNCGAPLANCNAQQMANYDLWQWERQLDGALETANGEAAGGLVQPTVCIAGPAAASTGTYTITIAWRGMTESRNSPAGQCGVNSGKYDDNDAYRRAIVMRTYISDV